MADVLQRNELRIGLTCVESSFQLRRLATILARDLRVLIELSTQSERHYDLVLSDLPRTRLS
jgi:hypothetical protein